MLDFYFQLPTNTALPPAPALPGSGANPRAVPLKAKPCGHLGIQEVGRKHLLVSTNSLDWCALSKNQREPPGSCPGLPPRQLPTPARRPTRPPPCRPPPPAPPPP